MTKTAIEQVHTRARRYIAAEQRYIKHQEYSAHPYGTPFRALLGTTVLSGIYSAELTLRAVRLRRAITQLNPHLNPDTLNLTDCAPLVAADGAGALEPQITVTDACVAVQQLDGRLDTFHVPESPIHVLGKRA
ncbi:MAG TPA: hypothetical protein VFN56_01460 [Candidatus Saccharimonadales bacterium]|nr:hypothetical protein [Candidatus Saccharimonadales bacterium]